VQPVGSDLTSTIEELRGGGADYVFIDMPLREGWNPIEIAQTDAIDENSLGIKGPTG
jgi:hypothetical protein